MPFQLEASPRLLAAGAALASLLLMPTTVRAEPAAPRWGQAAPAEARFRGCEAAGWCRFWIESADPAAQSLRRVRPDGVVHAHGDDALAIAVRDRLNALLASMIHQHKHILLHDLHELNDGTFAATVTVNGANVASDPMLLELRRQLTGPIR
ncbi:MAG: hypothetical protein ACREMQ_01435 [Longimicrobiales bacterium]